MKERRALNNATSGMGGVDAPKDPISRAKLDLLIKRAAEVEINNTQKLGGFLRKDDVERERVERIGAVAGELRNARLLALKLVGKSIQEMETILEDWARGVCRKFEKGD